MFITALTIFVPNTETQSVISVGQVNGVYKITLRASTTGVFLGDHNMPAGNAFGSGNHLGYELPAGKDVTFEVMVYVPTASELDSLSDLGLYVTTTNPGASLTYFATLRQ